MEKIFLVLFCLASHSMATGCSNSKGGIAVSTTTENTNVTLSTESGDLVNDKVVTLDASLPAASSESFIRPEDCEGGATSVRSAFKTLVLQLWSGNTTNVLTEATALNYDLVLYTDTAGGNISYYLLTEKAANAKGQGFYIFNPSGTRNLILEAPHPLYDTDSDLVAARVLRETSAKALFVAGTHRCADSEASTCSGTTTVCGSDEAFRISDPAHFICNFFEAAHEAINDASDPPTFLQIHGFTQSSTEPDAILSDGVSHTASQSDVVLQLMSNLNTQLATKSGGDGVASCQSSTSPSTQLCATDNVQGRYTNGSQTDPCTAAATTANERFISLELSYDLRHDTSTSGDVGPEDLISAIVATF